MAWDTITRLRWMIHDPDADPEKLFDDEAIQGVIDEHVDDIHGAAAELWGIKAARVSEWYMAQTDGSLLARQQVFDHCLKMQDFHSKQAASQIVSVLMDGGSRPSEQSSEF